MPCILSLISLFLPVLSVSALVTLGLGSQASVLIPTEVKWTREVGDPTVFDLRYIAGGADVGLAVTVHADSGALSGTVPVTFPSQGHFQLKAVDYQNGNQVIATSPDILIGPDPAIPLPPPTTSISTQGPLATTPSGTSTSTSTTPASTSLPSPSPVESTTSPPSTSASSTSTPPVGSSMKPTSNTAVIVGGVIGGLAVLLLLFLLVVFLKRRRENLRNQRRQTFHRDMMVQHRPPPISDLESGAAGTRSPVLPRLGFQQPITVPTPRGPTKAQFPASAITMPDPEPAPTPRQMRLGDRIQQLEKQMAGLRRQNRGQGGLVKVLEDMQMQVEWLQRHWNSPWALGETDVAPPQLHMYIAVADRA